MLARYADGPSAPMPETPMERRKRELAQRYKASCASILKMLGKR